MRLAGIMKTIGDGAVCDQQTVISRERK